MNFLHRVIDFPFGRKHLAVNAFIGGVLVFVLLLLLPAHSQPLSHNSLGYQQLTSISTATGLTVPSGTNLTLIYCTGQAVRWRDDGTNPTASVGIRLPTNTMFTYNGQPARWKVIEETPTAVCDVMYYT